MGRIDQTLTKTTPIPSMLDHGPCGPAPRSPLHRLSIRLRRSRSTTSRTEYSLPGATHSDRLVWRYLQVYAPNLNLVKSSQVKSLVLVRAALTQAYVRTPRVPVTANTGLSGKGSALLQARSSVHTVFDDHMSANVSAHHTASLRSSAKKVLAPWTQTKLLHR